MLRVKLFFLIVLLAFSGIILGDEISFSVDLDADSVSIESSDNYDIIRYRDADAYSFAKPGEPDIPAYIVRVLVPADCIITDVRITKQKKTNLGRVAPYPYQGQHPVSLPAPEFYPPDKEVYTSGLVFPSENIIMHSISKTRGFHILSFSWVPFEYDTASGELTFYDYAGFEIEYALKKDDSSIEYRPNKIFNEIIKSSVVNPDDFMCFYSSKYDTVRRATDYDMLIITTDTLKTAAQSYASYRQTEAGIISVIKTVSEIESEYTGATTQLKIKNCIYDYVQNSNITYAFLIGDGGSDSSYSVPDQNVYGNVDGYYIDNTIPGDIFYSCFDNQFDWNADGDTKIGEMSVDNADISPDVLIGRLAVRTAQQITDYMNKVGTYIAASDNPSFLESLLLSGVTLWNYGDAEAKSEKMYDEYIAPYWDYHQKYTLYDSVGSVTVATLSDMLNNSMNFFHMATHGNVTIWGMESGADFDSGDALALTNIPGTVVTIACITNAFDPEVSGASDPCLGEAFARNPDGGSVVYIGASRYGFGIGTMNDHGSSFQYNDHIFKHILQDTFDHYIGSAFTQAKIDMVGTANSEGVFRWVHFALNFMGDPSLIAYKEVEGNVSPPSNFSAEGVSTSQIDLSWQKNDENNDVMLLWSLDGVFGTPVNGTSYNEGNTVPGGGTVLYKGSSTTCSHTGLMSSTIYYYRAFSYNMLSEYSAGRNTNAATFCDVINTLPYSQDFNDSTELPLCWEIIDYEGNGQVWQFGVINDGLSGTTGNYAYLDSDGYGYNGSQDTDLITPVLDLTNYINVEISFTHYFRQYSSASTATFAYSTDNGANWTDVQSWTATTSNPVSFSQVIAEVAGQPLVRFKWHYTGNWAYYWCVDDVLIDGDLNGDLYSVSLYADPDDIGVVLTGAGNYAAGSNVSIGASHSSYSFVEWTGSSADVALLNDPYSSAASFTMPERNVSLTAVFEEVSYTVSLYADPDDIGVVLTGAGNYSAGANVSIGASHSSYSFVEWTGSTADVDLLDDPSSASANFTMPARNVSLTAVFTEDIPEPAVPVFRFFNTARGGHLYTISETERDYIIENLPQWTYEGIKFAVYENQASGSTAAYRFFNTRTGIHIYTISETERDAIMELPQWNYEGIKFYVHENHAENTIPVYRFFNHVRGGHLYTVSETERDAVMQLPQWTYEGIPFYVFPYTR